MVGLRSRKVLKPSVANLPLGQTIALMLERNTLLAEMDKLRARGTALHAPDMIRLSVRLDVIARQMMGLEVNTDDI
ncbi:MAG: hypothetical protein GX030_01625 [Firmicutes bacterium]|nr:hypothetical protein [Bacillota bacterium]